MSRSGSENRKRNIKKTIRLNEEEWRQTETRMDRSGLSLGELFRHGCLGANPPPRKLRTPGMDQKLASQLLGQLGKIGSNINQIAHAANMDRYMRGMHEAALVDLAEMRAAWFEAFGKRP